MKNKNYYIELIVALLVFFISGEVVLENVTKFFYPTFAVYFTWVRYILLLLVIHHQVSKKTKVVAHRGMLVFLFVYLCYIFADITFFRIYPLDELMRCPATLSKFWMNSLFLFALLYASPTIITNLNFRYITVIMSVGVLIPALLYVNLVGIETLQAFTERDLDVMFLSNLTMQYACVSPMVLSILFCKKLFSVKSLNYAFVAFTVASTSYIMMAGSKRGPILWLIVTLFVMYYFISRFSIKYILYSSIIIITLILTKDLIISGIEQIAPFTAERIRNAIYEGDTSHRMDVDEAESCYFLAINQFSESPIFGSYFRLVTSNTMFRGVYPHNIFLEIMITMGLFGLVPFVYLLYKNYLNMRRFLFESSSPMFLIPSTIFLSRFFSLITTGSLLFNNSFWLSWYMIMIFPYFKNYKNLFSSHE